MKFFSQKIKLFLLHPRSQWTFLMLFYFLILMGLLCIYGFKATNTSPFIYNEF